MNSRLYSDILEVIDDAGLFNIFKNKHILITGATGLIGSVLAKSIAEANGVYNLGCHIICHVRSMEKAKRIYGECFTDTIYSFVDTPLHTLDIDCDYIVHGASPTTSSYFITHPVDTIRTAVFGTDHMLEIARKYNVQRMVYLSSMEQYGVPSESGQVMTEDKLGYLDHLNVRSSYSESKRLCECLCKSYAVEFGMPVVMARLAQTFGAGVSKEDNRVFMQFTNSALRKDDIVLHTMGDSMSNFCYLTDAVRAILLLLQNGIPGEAYNVCYDEETRSIASIANLVADVIGEQSVKVVFNIPHDTSQLGYAPTVHMFLDSSKIRNLGWQPRVSMKEAYKRLAEYLIEEQSGE